MAIFPIRCRRRVIAVAVAAAALALAVAQPAASQAVGVLRIKIVLVDADGKSTPIPRHALLISDNPATITPREIVTGADGTVEVRLRAGNYTVESDHPVVFQGKSYQWTRTLDIAAGRDAALELTTKNAEVEDVTTTAAVETDPWVVLPQWEDSVFALWTPIARASGFVIDAKGLIATSQRAIGTATSIEVQVTPAVKVAANVLAADAARDVAVLWIDPAAVASIRPIPLACTQPPPTVASGEDIFTIGVPMRQLKGVTPGTLTSVDAKGVVADMRLSHGAAGGPVFTPGGSVIGMSSLFDEQAERSRTGSPIVRVADVCTVVAAAEKKMERAATPSGSHLPVEPAWPLPEDAFKEAAKRRAGGLGPYQMASANFDVSFITPVMTYGARYQAEIAAGARSGGGSRTAASQQVLIRPTMDFGNWSEYVDDYPPVLLVRITPKMVESFWTTVARGAAQTQGVAVPAMKHFASGFLRMRALCGDADVTPIHPLKLEHRVSATDSVYEGLYVFDPGAFGPQCATVKLVLYAEKEPEKADTRVVDPRLLQQITDDFALYRVTNR
jgi:S1-C subfamily serine protease